MCPNIYGPRTLNVRRVVQSVIDFAVDFLGVQHIIVTGK